MFYTAQEHICVAESDSPEGPFIQKEKKPVREEKSIDSSLFIDEDGTPYIYFVRFTGGNVIWCAEMNPDFRTIKEETLRECIRVGEPWELAQDVKAKVAEGPSVFRRGGRYYMPPTISRAGSTAWVLPWPTILSDLGGRAGPIRFSSTWEDSRAQATGLRSPTGTAI